MKKTSCKKKILKEAGILFITAFLILSTTAVIADTPKTDGVLGINISDDVVIDNEQLILDESELRFDDGTTVLVICDPTAGHLWEAAIRATPEETAQFDGMAITKVGFMHSYGTGEQLETHEGKVKIYDEGTANSPGTLLNDPATDEFIVEEAGWFEIVLSTPIQVNGTKDIWISIETTTAPLASHYFGTDGGPNVEGKGDWFKYGGSWMALSPLIDDSVNWNLYAILEGDAPGMPELKIEISADGITIENVGDANATNVEYNVNITGGIFDLIDKQLDGDIENLGPAEKKVVEIPKFFGLGKFVITAEARASNAPEVTETAEGFIFLFIILGL